ncbi:MAG: carbohydrate ABC transporter permease [Oscillospiraceae bacterium]
MQFGKKNLTPQEIEIRNYKRKKFVSDSVWPIVRFLIIFGLCFVILYPILYMISTAFSPQSEMNDPSRIWIPKQVIFTNITDAWEAMDYPRTFGFTLLVNGVSSLLMVLSCAITGYGFARFKFKGQNLLFAIVILMIIVPPQILSLQQKTQFQNFPGGSILNTPLVMYLPAMFANGLRAGLFILIFRQFFKGLPKELEDAAYLDGCGPLKTFFVVMVPNAVSSFITVFLFSIVWYWNDTYMLPMFYSGHDSTKTVAMKISDVGDVMITYLFGKADGATKAEVMVWLEAACLLAIIPILVLYICLQKYFTEGIARSGLVG